MKVSIIIPCYKQAHFLPDAIDSALAQTHKDIEIIVVDDGSPDKVAEVAAKYPTVTLIQKQNGGLSSARNAGIRHSKGDYIVTLDADDKLHPDFITKCLEKTPKADIVSTWLQTFGNENRKWGSDILNPVHQHFLQRNMINCCSLVSRKVFKEIGGYDEDMKIGFEDWELWQRATKAGFKVEIIPEYLFFYRKHGVSMFADAQKRRNEIIEYMNRKRSHTRELIDVVYIVGSGSQSANNELRFSLRSLEKYASGIGKVYVIGEKIKFLRNCINIQVKEGNNKALNILNKLKFACELPELSDRFLFINDDHFFTKYVDLPTFPNYYNNNEKEKVLTDRNPMNPYRRIVEDTALEFGKFDFYDIHKPIIIEKTVFLTMCKRIKFDKYEYGLLVKSSYAKFAGLKGVYSEDVILRERFKFDEITSKVKDTDCFSIHDDAIHKDFILYMDINYPVASLYEV